MPSADFPVRAPPEQLDTQPRLSHTWTLRTACQQPSYLILASFPSHPTTTHQLPPAPPPPHHSTLSKPPRYSPDPSHFLDKKLIHPSFPLPDMLLRKAKDIFPVSPFLNTIPVPLFSVVRIQIVPDESLKLPDLPGASLPFPQSISFLPYITSLSLLPSKVSLSCSLRLSGWYVLLSL